MPVLLCSECGREYDPSLPRWKCECGGLLDLSLLNSFEPGLLKNRPFNMWRYREVLPIDRDENIVSFQEGFTPLLKVLFGTRKIFIKQDHLFPSGSYKDRGASVLVSKIKELGIHHVVEDSSGNAGAAAAAYCAHASIACDIYVPEKTSPGKLIQIQSYGAHLYKIPGTREDTAAAVLQAAENTFYASHSWNPYFFQGTKTFSYEVCEQLGWKAPDTVILPVGNGTLFLGAYFGFRELQKRGILDAMPKMVGVQSAACAPLFEGYRQGKAIPVAIEPETTAAEGIAIANPVRGKQILHAVRKTGGSIVAVREEEILTGLSQMYKSGFYIEPTSGAAVAGIKKYLETAEKDEVIVSVFTGHGLKSGGKVYHE